MNIYFVNRYSKLKGPFDIIDSNRQHIIKVGDICLRDTFDGIAFYVIYNSSNTWNACKLVGLGTNETLSEVGNTLLFSFDGLSRRKGNIALIKLLAQCFRERVIDDFFNNAIDILEYKKDFWEGSLFPQFFASSQELVNRDEQKKSDIIIETKYYPTVFTQYLTKELQELLLNSLNEGNELKEAYLILREKHPELFRKALLQFLTDNPSGSIYDKPADEFVPIVKEVETPKKISRNDRIFEPDESIDVEPLEINKGIEHFLTEIGREPLLSADEEVELAKKIRKGEAGARNKLVRANMRFVTRLAKQYLHKGVEFEDLLHEGYMGLIKAAEHFDETRGFNFFDYATWWIKRYLTDAIVKKTSLIRFPLNVHTLHRRIWDFKKKYENKNGYLPPISEIEVDDDDNLERISFLDSLPQNLNNTCIPCEDLDVFEGRDNDIWDYENNDYNRKYVKTLLSRLSQREQDILRKFYGIGVKEETLEAIGEYYGLTRERARQIKEKAVRKLRDIKNIVWTKLGKTELRMIRFGEEAETKDTQDVKATSIIKDIYGELPSNSANTITSILQINKTDQTNTEKEREKTVESELLNQPNTEELVDNNVTATSEPFIDKERVSLSTEKIYEVFNNVVSTYKFYWFISILQIYQKTESPKIYVYDIIARMIANAWRQITCYRLSFGSSDSLQKIVSELQVLTVIPNEAKIDSVYNILIRRQKEPLIRQQMQILTRNVPSRFLTPWKRSLSNEESYDSECLYSLIMDDEKPYISINPLWGDYLKQNYEKLMDFSYQELASFLKKRNPNVKDILSKIKGQDKVKNNYPQGYTVVNVGNQCGIFDGYGVQVLSSTGKIKEINSTYYRFYYTYSSFAVNIIQHDEEMKFSIGKRIINVSDKTPLYKALDDNRWLEQIETIKYNEKRGYSIKVLNKWYDELGNNLHESPDDSTVQAISRDKENEIGLLTALNNNKTIKLPFKKEDWKNDVAPASHFENDQHRDKKTTLLSYNGHEFRLKVGDFVTLGFMFSSPVTFSSDPYFLFRRNILFVFIKSETDNVNEINSSIYLLPTDTQSFKKQFSDKYGSRKPRILFFVYQRATAVQFLDEVKIQEYRTNCIRFESLLSQEGISSVEIKAQSSEKTIHPKKSRKIGRDYGAIREAAVGDRIIYNSKKCTVIEKLVERDRRRLIIKYDDGTVDNVPNYRNRYQVL